MQPTNEPTAPDNNQAAPPAVAPPPPSVDTPSAHQPGAPSAKNSTFLSRWGGPKARMAIFALVFAGIGGYFIFSSFAASVSNESALLQAFRNLGVKNPSKVVTSGSVTYTDTNTKFKTANLNSTTLVDRWGTSDTTGILAMNQTTGRRPTAGTPFPFEVRAFRDGETYLKLSNSAKLKDVLPTDSNLQKYLKNQDADFLSRLENNWYYVYYDEASANKAPGADGLGCLVNTSLVPNGDDMSSIGQAYSDNPALVVTKSKNVYTVKPADSTKLGSFMTAISNTGFVKGLNDCGQLIGHSNANDKLSGAIAANNPSLSVTLTGKNISKVVFSSSGPKAKVSLSSTLTYGGPAKGIEWPGPTGDLSSYMRHLAKPDNGENNNRFSYILPSGWGADYCVYYGAEFASINLFPGQKAKGPYCGYSDDVRAGLSADVYQYDYSDFSIDNPDGNSAGAKLDKATDTVANKVAPVKNLKAAKANGMAVKKSALAKGAVANSRKKCTDTVYTDSTVTIDGKEMQRTDYVTGTCDKDWIAPGTKGVWVNYSKDEPTSDIKGTYSYFDSFYFQRPNDPDTMSAYNDMLNAVDLKF